MDAQRAFVQEALRMQQLRHPHVLAFFGVRQAGSLQANWPGSRVAAAALLGWVRHRVCAHGTTTCHDSACYAMQCLPAARPAPCSLLCPVCRSLDGPRGIILAEYCEGRDLHSALQLQSAGGRDRVFGWYRRGRSVAVNVAAALNYLHSMVRPWAALGGWGCKGSWFLQGQTVLPCAAAPPYTTE